MKFLIVGRSGTGKDTLQEILVNKYNFIPVISYSTRKMRPGEQYGKEHFFLDENLESFKNILMEDVVAQTEIVNDDGKEDLYFATRSQVEQADCYIIDPVGAYELLRSMPDTDFSIVYLETDDFARQAELAARRNGDPSKFVTRYNNEKPQFAEFEKNIELMPQIYQNCKEVLVYNNDYSEACIKNIAKDVNNHLIYSTLDKILA